MDEDLQKIIDKYAETIYRIAFEYLRIKSDAEDIVQEVLIKYMLNKKKFKDENHERNWIIRVTSNYSNNLKKSGWKRYTIPINEDLRLEYEYQYEIFGYLDLLKDKYRSVVQLYYFQDISIKQISKILDISEDSVKTRLKRARKMMKKIINEGGFLDV